MIKTKILILIPSLNIGGAERVLVNLLKKFDYSRYEIDLLVAVPKGFYFNIIPGEVNILKLFTNELIAKIFVFFHIKFNFNLFYQWRVRRKIKKHYDVGISFLDSSYTDILFFLNDRIRKKIGWVHASYQSYINYSKFYTQRYKSRIINNRYNKLDAIVFVSNDSMMEFINIFGKFPRMEVIYNILDISNILEKSKDSINENFNRELCNIIAMGSLYPVKAYDKLIFAAELLKKDGLQFHIRILGEGFLRNELQDLIEKLNLSNEIELKGSFPNPYPFLKASDIFVMTSISEALPTALCEAMILGLPAVVTNCSGCREIVDDGEYGLMVEPTIDGIYKGLRDIINNKDLRDHYKTKSLERSKIFNEKKNLKKIYTLIDEVVS